MAPAERIRENQRRSRARQKELVEDLQRQLRKYEAKEIQATLAMQLAARRVAWENTQLRALLASNGIARETIDGFISHQERLAARDPAPSKQGKASPVKTGRTDQNYMMGTDGVQTSFGAAKEAITQNGSPAPALEYGDPTHSVHATEALRGFDTAHSLAVADNESKSMLPPVPEHFCPTPPASSSLTEDDSPLGTMSCEVAAGIIAAMRGTGDDEQARSQLGCKGREDCDVNNMRVMQVMEMY